MDHSDKLLTPEEVSIHYFRGVVPITTLQFWRTRGEGPCFVKVGRRVFYRRSDIEAFVDMGRSGGGDTGSG